MKTTKALQRKVKRLLSLHTQIYDVREDIRQQLRQIDSLPERLHYVLTLLFSDIELLSAAHIDLAFTLLENRRCYQPPICEFDRRWSNRPFVEYAFERLVLNGIIKKMSNNCYVLEKSYGTCESHAYSDAWF